MGRHAGKRTQRYLDSPRDRSQLTCLLYGPGNLSDKFKVLNCFGNKYNKGGPFKEYNEQPAAKTNCGKKQELNYIFQHAVDDIILQETEN